VADPRQVALDSGHPWPRPPEYEQYAIRLANYRKEHPSLMKLDTFNVVPPEQEHYRDFYRELSIGVRENIVKINSMVDRYATKP
jgi:hypothetical protein